MANKSKKGANLLSNGHLTGKRFLLFSAAFITLFAAAIGAFLLFGNPEKTLQTLSEITLLEVFLLILLTAASVALRTFRWNSFLKAAGKKTRFWPSFESLLGGLAIGLVTPAKAGEFSRCLIYKKRDALPVAFSLPLIIFERLMDFVLILSLAVSFLLGRLTAFPLLGIAVMSFLGIIAFALAALSIPTVRNRLLPRDFAGAVKTQANLRNLLSLGSLTLLIWSIEFLRVFLGFRFLGMSPGFLEVSQIASVAIVAGIVSAIPGGLGAAELSSIALYGLVGISAAQSLAAVFLDRLVGFWPVVLGGIVLVPSLLSSSGKARMGQTD